jgi:hypothetical protein
MLAVVIPDALLAGNWREVLGWSTGMALGVGWVEPETRRRR